MKKVKLLAVLFLNIVLFSFLTSCSMSYRGTSYGRVIKKCPTANPTSFFFMQGTGKPFLPRYAMSRRPIQK
jgi:hypothetical protein